MYNARRVNVRAVICRGNTILAVRHKDENGVVDDYWALPGGGLDPMESLADGVCREVFEELGVKSTAGRLLAVQQFKSKRSDFEEELEFFFSVNDSAEFDTIDLSKASHGLAELAEVRFIDPKKEFILPELMKTIDLTPADMGGVALVGNDL